ncbi:MAG: cytochrome c [Pyrinomonadaceae bacterium]|nr:cytochrome c [Pyrinomonadaceae bacterium]
MFRTKLVILLAFIAVSGLSACISSSASKPYVMADDQTYQAALFRQNCAVCHGREGEGAVLPNGTVIPSLRDAHHKFNTRAEIYNQITHGGNGMTPFERQLTDNERQLLTDLVYSKLRGGK